MDGSLAALAGWYHLVLVYAIVLGLEGPLLLVLARVKRRPWYEQLLAPLPVAGFCWALLAARSIKVTYDIWQNYLNFQLIYYGPAYIQRSLDGLQSAVDGVKPLVWQTGLVTGLLLILGWGLFIYWYAPKHQPAPASTTSSTAMAHTEDGTLEISIEPMGQSDS